VHEFSLISNLLLKIESMALEHGAEKVVSVNVRLGALSHISPEHFREHFLRLSQGTVAEGARLNIEVLGDKTDPHAQEIILESIEVEE
jgi:hydrogenase nickel incorporation protein HypA/HybF